MANSVADVIVQSTKSAGVPFFFGYPGDSNIELMESARVHGVETILARREGTAAFMAEAFGMLTGVPGVCLSTLGPGSTSLVNGVAAANLDRAPLLALSGQINSQAEPYFTHQVVDHGRLFESITKWTARIEPGAAATVMRRAIRTAMVERPGAVHLTINSDVAISEASDATVRNLPRQFSGVSASQDPCPVIDMSRKPVILAGAAIARVGAEESLVRFAESFGIPVVVTPMAKGVIAESHSLFAGVLDMACPDVVWEFLDDSDLVVAVGFDPVELIKPWSVTSRVLHIDAVPNTDQVYYAEAELVGSIGTILDWLSNDLSFESHWTDVAIRQHRARLRDGYYAGYKKGVLNPTDVVDAVAAIADRDAIVTSDVGSHKLLIGQGWPTHVTRTCLMSNGLSSMGFSLPAAIAAKLTAPGQQVVCMTGDGGLAMVMGELRLAASMGLSMLVVVFSDNSLNRIELKQMAKGYPSVATRIDSVDMPVLAASMGCNGERVTSRSELERVLQQAGTASTPLVIEAVIDPSQYEAQF